MRNLKKILALVLALVMSLSLMATAGAGSFQDVTDDNPYKTAIDVLDELKVFQGFEDGTFKPTDTLTRAQAAVLVYRIATGDVEGKYVDNYTYMAQSKFVDLDGYNWAKGHINYCQNAGIVVGTDATHFNPGGQVTGYQLLVMLLRTLGYGKAGEFTDPKGWELQTAKIAEREGILKNVTGGDFEHAAPRQMVAEILFRGILHDTVEYSPLTPGGYTNSGVALGKKTLGLEDIEGVVVANRIADLYDTEPMKDGQTRMIVDGKDYVIDMDTDATAIGLNHHAYVKDGKVLGGTLEAAGNVIGEPEHGEAAKVADLAKAAGIKVTGDTEHYLNFDKNIREYSEWRLEYNVKFANTADRTWFNDKIGLNVEDEIKNSNKLDTVDADGYTRIIPRESKITPEDVAIMKGIFTYADNEDSNSLGISGYVFAGTNSQEEVKRNLDLSDTMTWKNFYNDYILGDDSEIKSSDNGEWLRVIDNNGDGVAEYVLRTDFIMTTVLDYEKRTDLYNVEYDVDGNGTTGNNIVSKIPAGEIRKDDNVDMSVGAVILYTYIDGWYYISNPEVQVLTVDKKSIDQKKNTFTADGETYTWSGIDEEAAKYYDDVSELNYDIAYNMYFDHFGFIRLATEARRNFVLLTDAYFKTDLRDHEWKVELYNGEEKIESADVVDAARDNDDRTSRGIGYDKKVDGFIDTVENDHQGNRGTWQRLNTFGEFYQQVDDNDYVHYIDKNRTAAAKDAKDPFYTNIALASETDGTWTLQDVTDIDTVYNSLRRNYNVYELAGTNKQYNNSITQIKQDTLKAKNTDLWGITGNNLTVAGAQETSGWTDAAITNLQAIQTNNLTQYYLVENAGNSAKRTVTSWVGYKNLPADLDNFVPLYAYAVTHGTNSNYEIADVVVFEGTYEEATKIPQLVTTGINPKWINALGVDADGKYTEHTEDWALFTESQLQAVDTYTDGLYAPQLRFYADKKTPITPSMYKDYGIYAGTVVVAEETKDAGEYIELSAWGDLVHDRVYFNTNDVEAYEIDQITRYNGEAAHNLKVNVNENILKGDKLIVVMEGKTVKMVVNVSASGKDGEPWANRRTGVETPANRIVKLAELYTEIETVMTNPAADPVVTVKYVNVPADVDADTLPEITGTPVRAGSKDYKINLSTAASAAGGYTLEADPAASSKGNYSEFVDGAANEYYVTNVTGDVTIEVSFTGTIKNLTIDNGSMTDVEVWVGGEKVATPYTSNPVAVGTEVRVAFKTTDANKPGKATATGITFDIAPTQNKSTGKWEFSFNMPTGGSDLTVTLGEQGFKSIPIRFVGSDKTISLSMDATTGAAGTTADFNTLKLLVNGSAITTGKKFVLNSIKSVDADGTKTALTVNSDYTFVADTGVFTGTSTTMTGWTAIEIDAKVVADTCDITVDVAKSSGTPISNVTITNALDNGNGTWTVVKGTEVVISFTNSDDLVVKVDGTPVTLSAGKLTKTINDDTTVSVDAIQEYTVTVKSIPNVEIAVAIDGDRQSNRVNGADVDYTIKGSAEVTLEAVAAADYILIGGATMTETVSSNKTLTMNVKAEAATPPAQAASDFTGGAASDAGKKLNSANRLHTGDAVGGAAPVSIEAKRENDGSITITPTLVDDNEAPIKLSATPEPSEAIVEAMCDYWYQPGDKENKAWSDVVGAMVREDEYDTGHTGFLVYLDYADYTEIIFVTEAKVEAKPNLGQKIIDGVTYTIDWTKVVAALNP